MRKLAAIICVLVIMAPSSLVFGVELVGDISETEASEIILLIESGEVDAKITREKLAVTKISTCSEYSEWNDTFKKPDSEYEKCFIVERMNGSGSLKLESIVVKKTTELEKLPEKFEFITIIAK